MSKKETLKQLIESEIFSDETTDLIPLPKFLRKIREIGLSPYVKINKKGDILGFFIRTSRGNQALVDYIGSDYGWKVIKNHIHYNKAVHADKIKLSNLNMNLLN